MRLTLVTLMLIGAVVGIFTGCTRNVAGGNSALPLSGSNGTSRNFAASPDRVANAVTNAFLEGKYRGMFLSPAQDNAYLVDGWHPTNGLVLFPIMGDIASVPLTSGVTVPYWCAFYITIAPVDRDHSTVTVRSIKSSVADGQEPGIHGGWARHSREVPPIRQEEESVISAIAGELLK